MVLIQTNEFQTKNQNWFLKEYTVGADKQLRFTWTDVRKEAHDFKHMDNPDFLMLLEHFAEHYWKLNITYVTPKK